MPDSAIGQRFYEPDDAEAALRERLAGDPAEPRQGLTASLGRMDTATATTQLESFNPATGEPVGSVQTTAPEDVQAVVDSVAAAAAGVGAAHAAGARARTSSARPKCCSRSPTRSAT